MAAHATPLFKTPQAIDPEVKRLVLENLDKVCSDKLFKDTTRMKRFLSYVVSETLAGRKDRVKGYSIGLEVFDRPESFDPQADTIVRVQAGQLRRRLDHYYASSGKGDPVRIIIPKGQYTPVFEMRRNLPEPDSALNENNIFLEQEDDPRPGIAVLTFSNLSEDRKDKYFAEGLTTEIVSALVQFRHMRIVTSLATVEARSLDVDVKGLARNYNVQFVLSGSVRRVQNVLRVSVSLISANNGEHIFSTKFDKEYSAENIFNLQEEIASYTAAKIAAPFGVVTRYNRRSNLARLQTLPSYEALLKFYYLRHSPSKEKLDELIVEFEKLTNKQPRYSSAWAVMAILYVYRSTQTIYSQAAEACFERALKYAHKAVAIDPENALAFMAFYQSHYHRGEFELAEKMAQRSMALNPNDYSMLAYYSIICAYRGRRKDALEYHSAALRLVDRPPSWFNITLIVLALRERRFGDVYKSFPSDVTTKNALSTQVFMLVAMGHLGKVKKAGSLLKESRQKYPEFDRNIMQIMTSWHPDEELWGIIVSGMRKAGLDI